jgi:hypothetical protein
MWQGNKDNPVPTNNNVEKNNPIVSNVRNIALDTRRDEDPKKNFTVTLLDVDTALINYLQNIINPTVVDGGENVKVPIIYGNPEKWYAAKAQGGLRDQQGKLQIPLIMVKRSSFAKDDGYRTFNRYLSYPVITKFNEKNKYDKFSLLNKTVAPTNQIFAVTMPDHIKVEYEFIVWTEYVEQNNAILEKINFAEGDYWGDKQRFNFRVTIDNYTNTIESSGEKDRMVRSTFTLSTRAYLLPESLEDRKQTVQRLLTPKQIKLTAEIVSSAEMAEVNKKVKENTYSNKGNPYYSINPIAEKDSGWRFPQPTIFSEKSTTAAKEAITTIRQTYAALITQQITSTNTSGSVCCSIWHDPPTTPNDYGENGWMAYDGDYHYIYANGRWLRQSIADWVS